ncbi:ATP-dependent DNA helicase PIF1-like protein [Tanacetum coccineum]
MVPWAMFRLNHTTQVVDYGRASVRIRGKRRLMDSAYQFCLRLILQSVRSCKQGAAFCGDYLVESGSRHSKSSRDVYAAMGRYLSTDFVVCDSKLRFMLRAVTLMHATVRNSIAHNFMKLKECGIYSVKIFAIQPNKDEFRVLKNATFMLELDGSTTIRKVFVKPDGFIRFPFEMVDFEHLETTNNKYLIDAAGYVTNVGRTVQQKSGSKTLDFHLANSRGQSVRVTLWGSLGELLIEKRTNHVGVYAIVLTCLTVKQYNSMLYMSSTSSTLILDDEDIPEIKQLKSHTRYRLELEVSDDTTEVVVVMFNETASSLVKCTVDSIVEYEDQRIVTAEGMDESGGSSIAGGSRASETPEFKRLLRHPSVTTPSKAAESDDEASFVADKQAASGVGGSLPDTRKHKRIESNTVIRQDGRVQSYCGLQLKGIGASIPSTSRIRNHNRTNVYQQAILSLLRCSQAENGSYAIILLKILKEALNVNQQMPQKELHLRQVVHLKIIMLPVRKTPSMAPVAYPDIHNSIPHSITSKHFLTAIINSDIGTEVSYHNIGSPSYKCAHCNATMWYEERVNKGSRSVNPSFSLCCKEGKIRLPKFNLTPQPLHNLLNYNDLAIARFRDQIRIYNSMFSFTSFGARIDHSINNGRGVYTFKVNGQSYHRIGSLLPEEGTQPRYAQLWFFDMETEVSNRMRAFIDKDNRDGVDAATVHTLTQMLDQYSSVAKAFRMARNWCHSHASVNVELRLLSERTNARQYNKPTVAEVAALITNDFGNGILSRDIIVNKLHYGPKRISELHPAYMALQYPLLFPYGEDGFHEKIPYYTNSRRRKTNRGFVTMKEYYSYIIHQRNDQAIEEQRLKWTRNNQDTLRVDLYHNVCDAVTRGDTNAAGLGQRIVLPETFVGGPRYMMQNYQDAMALCRTYGNPDLFITFTSNPKWPEISEMLAYIPGQKAHDRPEIGTRVFKMKLTDLLHDLTKNQIFGATEAIVYVIEFQKRGLPHAHILLWLEENSKCKTPAQIDDIISAELPSPTEDPEGYKVVTDYMLHGPCGKDEKYAPCITEVKLPSTKLKPSHVAGLRILASFARKRRGPKDFDELMTVNNRLCHTFKEACFTYGLLNDDIEWTKAIEEASLWALGPQLHDLYVTILLFCDVSRPLKVWKETWEYLSEDILHRKRKLYDYPELQLSIEQIQNYCLVEIQELLNRNGRSLTDFQDLPRPNPQLLTNMDNRLIREALNFDTNKSGTGKTFLYNTIIARLRTERKIVLAVASSGRTLYSYLLKNKELEHNSPPPVCKFETGIAALLLPGGRTAHSRFIIPLELLENSTCGIKQNTHLAELMQEVQLIIWDEAPMTQKYAFEALDKTLRDILGFQKPKKREQIFGGMTVLLGGDFRQILPVIPKGKRPDLVQACINRLELWKHCNVFTLTRSMRVNEYYPNGEIDNQKQDFNQWVLSVGNGTVPAKAKDGEDEPS